MLLKAGVVKIDKPEELEPQACIRYNYISSHIS